MPSRLCPSSSTQCIYETKAASFRPLSVCENGRLPSRSPARRVRAESPWRASPRRRSSYSQVQRRTSFCKNQARIPSSTSFPIALKDLAAEPPPAPVVSTLPRPTESRRMSLTARARRVPSASQYPPLRIDSSRTAYTMELALPSSISAEMVTITTAKGDKLKIVADAWHLESDCHYEWEVVFPPKDVNFASCRHRCSKKINTGQIKPAGWQLNQAKIQADGLAGHLRDFDGYVNGSIWVPGGSIEYSEMHESAPYWFNGMVSLAFQLEDKRLIGQVRDFLDWTLDNQGEDGWLGPEPFVPNATIPRLPWPRYLLLMGLIQYAEADPTQTTRILDAMHKFMSLANTIWKTGQFGDRSLGFQFDYQFVRWEELVYSLQWLVDTDPRDKTDELIETMHLVRETGFSWKENWFQPNTFPQDSVGTFIMQTHGVNTAEALKSEALAFRFTNDPSDRQNTFDRIDMLYKFHGRASGTFGADEHLTGLNPSRGTELCAVVEQIFSLALIYQMFGNNTIADRAEKIAYNALPAGILHDWSAHQYDQQVNQIWAQSMDPPPWGNNGPNSNVFGFEPNYPCCTVNHPQAFPKFWSHSFFTQPASNAIVHVLLGPFSVATTLPGKNAVKINVDTLYPFGTALTYTVSATKAFNLKIRVPEWAKNSAKSTIAVNGGRATALVPDSMSLHTVQVKAGKTTVHVNLNAPLEIESRFNDAIAVTRGPLNFAVEISHNTTVSPGLRSAQAIGDVLRLYPDAPAQYVTPFDNHTQDNVFLPTAPWALAIDSDTLAVHDRSATTKEIPFYAWAPGSSPITMTATACEIEWGLTLGTASAPPQSPVTCLSKDRFRINLVPFGVAKLRLGEIPVMA
ncbi:hypothetical protein MKEN_00237400 [Mycena kentingensis (nom. inval.)]|nr:hypothetical protein MKEN_00237400 [Mycena kentingensis (nom. inval.)]